MPEPKILSSQLLSEQLRYGQEVIACWTTLVGEMQKPGVAGDWVAPVRKYSDAWSAYCRALQESATQHWARCQQIMECDPSMQQLMAAGSSVPAVR